MICWDSIQTKTGENKLQCHMSSKYRCYVSQHVCLHTEKTKRFHKYRHKRCHIKATCCRSSLIMSSSSSCTIAMRFSTMPESRRISVISLALDSVVRPFSISDPITTRPKSRNNRRSSRQSLSQNRRIAHSDKQLVILQEQPNCFPLAIRPGIQLFRYTSSMCFTFITCLQ